MVGDALGSHARGKLLPNQKKIPDTEDIQLEVIALEDHVGPDS